MKNGLTIAVANDLPYFVARNEMVIEAGASFLHFTGYTPADVQHKNIDHVLNDLLRLNLDREMTVSMSKTENLYLFTKHLQVKEVTLCTHREEETSLCVYTFHENQASTIEDRFSFLEQVFPHSNSCIAIYSIPDLILLKANNRYLDLLKGPSADSKAVLGRKAHDAIPSYTGSCIEELFKQVVTTGKPKHHTEYMCDLGGISSSFWDITITPVIQNGFPRYLIKHCMEVTDRVIYRKRLEAQSSTIENQKDQLEAVIENMSDALLVFNRDGDFVKMNFAAREFFSSLPFPISNVHQLPSKLYSTDGKELPYVNTPIFRVMNGQKIIQQRLVVKGEDIDTYINVSGTPLFDSDGNFSMGVLCSRDITERIRYEESVIEQRDFLYKILDTLDLPLVRLSYPDFKLIEANKRALYEFSKLLGRSISLGELISSDTNSFGQISELCKLNNIPCIRQMHEGRGIVSHDRCQITVGDRKVYYKMIYQSILDFKNEITEVLISIIDVTSEVEEKNVIEESMSIKEEFLSLVSHELRTPLTVINSAMQTIESLYKSELSQNVQKHMLRIKQNSLRILRLVNNLLDITRANAGKIKLHKCNMDIVFISKVITESVSQYAQEKGIELSFTSTLAEKIIAIDDEKYERILLNLLSNAIKFTPKGKSITVNISLKKNFVCIQVKDKGIGIPKEKQSLIFERFGQVDSLLTRKAEGAGIGLSLVKSFIEALGGKILVASKEGKGSTFTIMLPDIRISDSTRESSTQETYDNRLIQTTAVEFSDIYLK